MDPARELAQLGERVGELRAGALQQVLGLAVGLGLGDPQHQRQRDEPLLRAVVEVALEPAALVVAGRDDPGARRRELLPRLGVGQRERDQLGEVGDPLLGAGQERLRLGGRDHHRAPELPGQRDRRADRGGEAVVAQPGGVRPGHGAEVVDAGGPAGGPDPRRGGRAVERELRAGRDRLGAGRAPRALDRRRAVVLEPDHVGGGGTEEPGDLLGRDGEDALRVVLARDDDRDAPERRLLRGEVAQLLLVAAALRDVADVAGEHRRAAELGPRDPDLGRELAAVGAHRGQLERVVDHPPPARAQVAVEPVAVRLAQRRRDDQLGEVPADHVLRLVAEHLLGRAVDLDDVAGGVHRDDRVERRVEDRGLAGFGAPALDGLADPPAQARHRREQRVVGLALLLGEELDHAEDAGRAGDREGEGGVEAGLDRAGAARLVLVGLDVGDPGGAAAGVDRAGESLPRVEPGGVERLRRVPGGDPLERGPVELPQRAGVPLQRAADRLEDAAERGALVGRVGEDAGDRVLGAQEGLGVGLPGAHRVAGPSHIGEWCVSRSAPTRRRRRARPWG